MYAPNPDFTACTPAATGYRLKWQCERDCVRNDALTLECDAQTTRLCDICRHNHDPSPRCHTICAKACPSEPIFNTCRLPICPDSCAVAPMDRLCATTSDCCYRFNERTRQWEYVRTLD